MSPSFSRSDRVGAFIQEEITDILRREVTDPRIGFITVTHVEVTNDLRLAKIFVSILGDECAKTSSLRGLKSASGFIRRILGPRLNIRFVPEIEFRRDDTMEKTAKVLELFHEIERQASAPEPGTKRVRSSKRRTVRKKRSK